MQQNTDLRDLRRFASEREPQSAVPRQERTSGSASRRPRRISFAPDPRMSVLRGNTSYFAQCAPPAFALGADDCGASPCLPIVIITSKAETASCSCLWIRTGPAVPIGYPCTVVRFICVDLFSAFTAELFGCTNGCGPPWPELFRPSFIFIYHLAVSAFFLRQLRSVYEGESLVRIIKREN